MAKGKYEKWLEPENLILLEGWARDGLTDDQIAHNMGIRRETLYDWKKKFPNISNSLKKGKEVVDLMVENALLKRALGCTVEETKVTIKADGSKEAVKTTKSIPGDVVAQIFWLKNRRPDKWREKPVADEELGYEDDGLMEALKAGANKLVDDMDMIQKDGEENGETESAVQMDT